MINSETSRLVIAAVIALLVFGFAQYFLKRFAKSPILATSFSLESTISDIKSELQKLENMPGPALGLVLSEVQINLLVQEDDSSSSTAKLAVPVFDKDALEATGQQSTKSGSRITVVLVPPMGNQVLSAGRQTAISFADLLASARTSLQHSMKNEPRLDAKSIDVELSFVLVTGASGHASVQAKIVSVGTTSGWQLTNSNTVTLKYVNPAYQGKDNKAVPIPP